MNRLLLFFLFCIVVTGCATTSLPPVTSKNFAFEEDEKRIWMRSEEEQRVMNKSGFIYHDEELEKYLNDVARKLQPPQVYQKNPFKKKAVEQQKQKEPFFFGTQPRLQERIDNYNTFLQTYYPGQKGIDNRELFLGKVYKVIIDNAGLDLKAGRYTIAQREVEKYLNIKPNEARAYYLLGEIARKRGEKGDMEKTLEHYEKAVSINATYPEPYKGLGFLYYKQEKKELARKYFEQYLAVAFSIRIRQGIHRRIYKIDTVK